MSWVLAVQHASHGEACEFPCLLWFAVCGAWQHVLQRWSAMWEDATCKMKVQALASVCRHQSEQQTKQLSMDFMHL